MSKRTRNLLIAIVALAVIIGLLAGVLLFLPSSTNQNGTTNDKTSSVTLSSLLPKTKVNIQNISKTAEQTMKG